MLVTNDEVILDKTPIVVRLMKKNQYPEYESIETNESGEKVVNFVKHPSKKVQSLIQVFALYKVVEMTVPIGISYVFSLVIDNDRVGKQVMSALKGTIFPCLRRLFIYTQSELKKDFVVDLIGDRHPKLEEIWVVSVKSGVPTVRQTKNETKNDSSKKEVKMTTQPKEEPKEVPKEMKNGNVTKETIQSQTTSKKVYTKEEIDAMRNKLVAFKKDLADHEQYIHNLNTIIENEKPAEEAVIKHFNNRYLHVFDYKISTIEDGENARLVFSLYTTIKESGVDINRRLYICYNVKKDVKPLSLDSTQSPKYHMLVSADRSFSVSVSYGITYTVLYEIIHGIISADRLDSTVSDLVLYSNYMPIPTSDNVIPKEHLCGYKVIVAHYTPVPVKQPHLQEIIDSKTYKENLPILLFGKELIVQACMLVLII